MTADEPAEGPSGFLCPRCKRPVSLQLVSIELADWFHEDGTKRCEWSYPS